MHSEVKAADPTICTNCLAGHNTTRTISSEITAETMMILQSHKAVFLSNMSHNYLGRPMGSWKCAVTKGSCAERSHLLHAFHVSLLFGMQLFYEIGAINEMFLHILLSSHLDRSECGYYGIYGLLDCWTHRYNRNVAERPESIKSNTAHANLGKYMFFWKNKVPFLLFMVWMIRKARGLFTTRLHVPGKMYLPRKWLLSKTNSFFIKLIILVCV